MGFNTAGGMTNGGLFFNNEQRRKIYPPAFDLPQARCSLFNLVWGFFYSHKSKMMGYKIEKNIPMPEARDSYPLTDMEVGDSFAVPFAKGQRHKIAHRVSGAVAQFQKRYPKRKFTCRTMENVIRCWRVK